MGRDEEWTWGITVGMKQAKHQHHPQNPITEGLQSKADGSRDPLQTDSALPLPRAASCPGLSLGEHRSRAPGLSTAYPWLPGQHLCPAAFCRLAGIMREETDL